MSEKSIKILYFTFMPPSVKFGGGLGVLKSLNALCKIGDVYYIGPEFNMNEVIGYDIKFIGHKYIKMEAGLAARFFNLLRHGSPSLFVRDWYRTVSDINPHEFDLVYLERTLQGFVCQWARKAKLPIVVMTHNVEYDFIRNNGPLKTRMLNALFSENAKRNEKKCIQSTDKAIVLTQKDCNRFVELYGNKDKFEIIPVCVNENIGDKEYEIGEPYILLTGSLWFEPNVEGIKWFLTNVWNEIESEVNYSVVIAGSNPNEELMSCVEKYERVHVISNPKDMGIYYRGASIFVAPIFDGAGMKVKVAEAMSYGLPIIATEHAVIGYEKGKDAIFIVISAEECRQKIVDINNMDDMALEIIRDMTFKRYKEFYSLEAFNKSMETVLDSLLVKQGNSFGDK